MKYIVVLITICLFSCSDTKTDTVKEEKVDSTKDVVDLNVNPLLEPEMVFEDSYSVKTLFSPEHGWGYQILNNGELYINQPHKPSVPGNEGFDSEEKAIITAEYIIYKLENGFFPPTVSPEELDSLGVM